MKSRYCTNCGNLLNDEKFCRKCGIKINDIPSNDSRSLPLNKPLKGIMFWGGWLLLMVTGICQAVICILNLGDYINTIDSYSSSSIYSAVFALLGLSAILGALVTFIVRYKKSRYVIGLITSLFVSAFSCAVFVVDHFFEHSSSMTISAIIKLCSIYSPIAVIDFTMGILCVAAMIIGNRLK